MTTREKVVGDDPLSMMFGAGDNSSAAVAPAVKTPEVPKEDETVFRQVDSAKISFAAPKKSSKKNTPASSEPVVTEVTSNKIAAATWESDLAKTGRGQPKIDTSKDLLMDLTGGGKSSASAENDLFGTTTDSSSATDNNKPATVATATSKVHIRGGGAEDEAESSLKDLKVSAMLEREEDLDYGLFGKVAKEESKPKASVTKKNADIFEMESDEYFNELEKVTSKKEKDTSKAAVSSTTASAAPAQVDIDMSSLDMNAYINAQAESSGGGLFD